MVYFFAQSESSFNSGAKKSWAIDAIDVADDNPIEYNSTMLRMPK